jgi:hypothetical protein
VGREDVVDPVTNDGAAGGGTVEAEVQLGDASVRYLRAGQGSPVLLLLEDPAGEDRPGETFRALARDHRVFQPLCQVPLGRDEAERWLRGLVEGLGLRAPDLVAPAELAPLLARLVRRNGGFVGRVVFLAPAGEADEAAGP